MIILKTTVIVVIRSMVTSGMDQSDHIKRQLLYNVIDKFALE